MEPFTSPFDIGVDESSDAALVKRRRTRRVVPDASDDEFTADVASEVSSSISTDTSEEIDEAPPSHRRRRGPVPQRPIAAARDRVSFYSNREYLRNAAVPISDRRRKLPASAAPSNPLFERLFEPAPPPSDRVALAEAARWRPRCCVTCWGELIGVCVNQACAACCPYLEATPTGRVCVVHGRMRGAHLADGFGGVMAIELVRDPGAAITNFDLESEAGRSAVKPDDITPHYVTAHNVYVCVCGSEWPNQKSFSGHCGQCDRWKKMLLDNRAMPRRPPYGVPPPFAGDEGRAEIFKLYPYPEVVPPEWKAVVDDYAMFPPLAALVSRSPVRSLVLSLTAMHLRIYIERFGVRAGPTELERRRQLTVLAEAGSAVGYAARSLAQPRWICLCGRHFRIEAALARHAVLCDDWEPCPSVVGVTASAIPIVDLVALCGARQPTRDATEVDAMRRAMVSADSNVQSFQVALHEARVATLQAMYAVPLRCALAHLDEICAGPELTGVMRLMLTRLRRKLQPLYDLITSPMTRRNTTVAQLEDCETTVRHWLQVMMRDPIVQRYIINRAIAEGE